MCEQENAGRPHPSANDPECCSRCGTYIGRFNSDDYCDGCAREVGAKPPIRQCYGCNRDAPEKEMKAIDVSPHEDYYPDIRYLCRDCERGGSSA